MEAKSLILEFGCSWFCSFSANKEWFNQNTACQVKTSEFWREFTRDSQLRRQQCNNATSIRRGQHSSGPSCRTSTCPEPARPDTPRPSWNLHRLDRRPTPYIQQSPQDRLLHLQLRTDPLDPYPFRLGVTAGLDGSAGLMRATSVLSVQMA